MFSKLRNLIAGPPGPPGPVGPAGSPLPRPTKGAVLPDSPGVITVLPIKNGYLVSTVEPTGSDWTVHTSYAPDLESVTNHIATHTAQLRLEL